MDREQRSCRSKVAFPTRRDARRAERQMRRRHGEAFTTYRCDYCGECHLAHAVPAWLRAGPVDRFERAAVRLA